MGKMLVKAYVSVSASRTVQGEGGVSVSSAISISTVSCEGREEDRE